LLAHAKDLLARAKNLLAHAKDAVHAKYTSYTLYPHLSSFIIYTISMSPTTLYIISVLADFTSSTIKEGKPEAYQLWLDLVFKSPLKHLIFAYI